jgi:hypothetical protein
MINSKEIDYNKPIRNFYPVDDLVLICLFPFYRQIFADHYNWEGNLKLTYPLLKSKTWHEVAIKVGFNTLERVALGILELKEPFTTELQEFCEHEKLDPPDFAADKIPEMVLIPIIEYLKTNQYNVLNINEFKRFPDSQNSIIDLANIDIFEVFNQLESAKFLKSENDIEILIPDYDCPYILISGKKNDCLELVNFCGLETFEADHKTKFDWWNK